MIEPNFRVNRRADENAEWAGSNRADAMVFVRPRCHLQPFQYDVWGCCNRMCGA